MLEGVLLPPAINGAPGSAKRTDGHDLAVNVAEY